MPKGEAGQPGLGAQLREVRGQRPLREIERRSGLNSGYLSQLENGKIAHPSPAVLRAVAGAYGVRYVDVLAWAGYGPDDMRVSPNQAEALNAVTQLGEPSREELEALKAIVNVLRQRRRE